MSQDFPQSYETSGGNMNVKSDLSSSATKVGLNGATGFDASMLALKMNQTSLKTKVDEEEVYKMKTVYANLSRLSNVINNDVVRKIVYYELVTKTKAIDTKISSTSRLVTKTRFDLHKQGFDKNIEDVDRKIPKASGLVKKIHCNTKLTEIEKKAPSVNGLVTTAALNTKAIGTEKKP